MPRAIWDVSLLDGGCKNAIFPCSLSCVMAQALQIPPPFSWSFLPLKTHNTLHSSTPNSIEQAPLPWIRYLACGSPAPVSWRMRSTNQVLYPWILEPFMTWAGIHHVARYRYPLPSLFPYHEAILIPPNSFVRPHLPPFHHVLAASSHVFRSHLYRN